MSEISIAHARGFLLLAQSDTYTSNECACAREIKEQAEQLSKGLAGAGNSAGFRDCCPRGEKERLEAAIRRKKTFLQETLSQRLRQPKQQRPDLFILSGPEQIVMLLKVFLK